MTDCVALLESYRPQDPREEADKALMLECCRLYGPAVLTREALAAHITSSAFVMSPDREWVLMAWHNIYRSWAWTGGHADGDADLLGVAIKEAREETGVTGLEPLGKGPASIEVIPVPPHQKRGREVAAHLHLNLSFLLLAPREGQQLSVKPDENSGVRWLPARELSRWCAEEHMLPIYHKLITYANRAG